ncbi:olfactory receptor 6M1-like [Phyllobates terribilis]|uniref:olfactory receptor 6M1-like n=1 Tax=Phyllobates terribilis TaxID=111132 RepID=UPI003CCA9F9E
MYFVQPETSDLEIRKHEQNFNLKSNYSQVSEFILVGFPDKLEFEILLFCFLLFLYIVTIFGNCLIILLVWRSSRLHTPMYFFLANYAFMEMFLSCIITPKVLIHLLSKRKSISYAGCMVQSYCFFVLGTADLILIAMMSYDRYIAVCNPLHYIIIMRRFRCGLLVALSWLGGFLSVSIPSIFKAQLPYCGPNIINHFFCDSVPLIQLVCADTILLQMIDFCLFSLVIIGSLIFVTITYTFILMTVLRIPSVTGRKKTFSTCTSHFTIMIIAYACSIFMYVTPRHGHSLEVNKVVSAMMSFIIPVINPFIFTLRNDQVQNAVHDIIKQVRSIP